MPMPMNIEEIRGIPITDFLAQLGHEPKRQRGDEYRYLAPYREERTASFQVNIRKNVWHDFGTGRGGDIFTLAGELTNSRDFKEQADFITRIYGGLAPERKTVFRPKENGKDDPDKKVCLTDIRFGPLYNKVLLRYLEERAFAGMWHCRTARKQGIPCMASGISPSVSEISAADTSCATASSREACRQRTSR